MPAQSIVLVDAFASSRYTGNPAAVCLLDQPASAAWMQSVAMEMNQAETAFLVRAKQGEPNTFDLRWFTPTAEVKLCGHATLASAHHLWESGTLAPADSASFNTLSGILTARRLDDGWIELDLPTQFSSPMAPPDGLAETLGVPITKVFNNSLGYFLVELADEATVRNLQPDIKRIATYDAAAIVVTARAAQTSSPGPQADFISRCFAPALGIDEDPVTGSAHCVLAPWWSERLGKKIFTAYQASHRGGWLRLTYSNQRTLVSGQAITTLSGHLL